jgi:hypothetical protein
MLHILPSKTWYCICWSECLNTKISLDFVSDFSSNLFQANFSSKVLHLLPSKSWYYILSSEGIKTKTSWDLVPDYFILPDTNGSFNFQGLQKFFILSNLGLLDFEKPQKTFKINKRIGRLTESPEYEHCQTQLACFGFRVSKNFRFCLIWD